MGDTQRGILDGPDLEVEDEFNDDTFDQGDRDGERDDRDGGEPFLLMLPPDPDSDTEPPPASESLQDRVIHIQASPDLTKPAVSGLRLSSPPGILLSKRQDHKTVFLCPEPYCKLRLPTQASVTTHVATCHSNKMETPQLTEIEGLYLLSDNAEDPLAEEEMDEDYLDLGDLGKTGDVRKRKRSNRESRNQECPYCGATAETGVELRKHVKEVHEELKTYQCSECSIKVSRKYHLIRHVKAVHQKEKFWQCEDCDYKTNNQVCYKKHKNNKHEGEDCDTIYSVESLAAKQVDESELRCVCTWCPFKSNKYSVVKKHIEIHHERKRHYPCKECVFIGQSVDDYAEHYHTFHKTDEYRHACTDCSFKCTNKHDLKMHYSEMHSKQRLYVCKMCDHKSNDVNNMKRHINTVHGAGSVRHINTVQGAEGVRRVYRCDQCEYQTDKKNELIGHKYNLHEGLTITTEDGEAMQQVKITLFNANSGDES